MRLSRFRLPTTALIALSLLAPSAGAAAHLNQQRIDDLSVAQAHISQAATQAVRVGLDAEKYLDSVVGNIQYAQGVLDGSADKVLDQTARDALSAIIAETTASVERARDAAAILGESIAANITRVDAFWASDLSAQSSKLEKTEFRMQSVLTANVSALNTAEVHVHDAVAAFEAEQKRLAEEAAAKAAAEAAAAAEEAARNSRSGGGGGGGGYTGGGGGGGGGGGDLYSRAGALLAQMGFSIGYYIGDCSNAGSDAVACYNFDQQIALTPGLADVSDCMLMRILAHEYRHAVQDSQGLIQMDASGTILNRDWLESDAYAFGNSYC